MKSTSHRRILKIKPSVRGIDLDNDDDERPVTLKLDTSGLTITKKGDYIEQKWIRKKKEFVKLHIAVDAKSEEIISFRVTNRDIKYVFQSGMAVDRRDAWKLLQFKMMPDVCKMLQDTVESRNLNDITYPIIDPFV